LVKTRLKVWVVLGIALWNMGAAYLGGLALWYGFQRRWLRL